MTWNLSTIILENVPYSIRIPLACKNIATTLLTANGFIYCPRVLSALLTSLSLLRTLLRSLVG